MANKKNKKTSIKNATPFWGNKSLLLITIGAFIAIGVTYLILAKAATNVVTFSGSLKSSSPTATHTVSPTTSGTLTTTLTYNATKIKGMTLSLKNSSGTVISQQSTTTSPVTLSANVVSGTYQITIQASGTWTKTAAYSLAVSYPIADTVTNTGIKAVKPNIAWNYQLGSVPTTADLDIVASSPNPNKLIVFDLFDTPDTTVTAAKSKGLIAVCYFSAGSWENWRPDASKFPTSVLGNNLSGWAGEKWLDVRQVSTLGPIMASRMDLAKQKGCDAVDPDNVDGFTNSTGFPLVAQDQLNYNKYLADTAHSKGLAVSLKNDIDQISQLQPYFDFAINEQCFQYSECAGYSAFTNAGKAVLNVEYKLTASSFCPASVASNFDSLKKDLNLLALPRESCR